MRKYILLIVLFLTVISLSGCEKAKVEDLSQNIKKMELVGNLVTYKAYYHNVVEYDKEAGSGLTHLFEKDRKLFIEYTGTIKLGIDLTNVKIDVKGNEINVFIPKATIIGEPNVDESDFKKENFIESKDGINKNKITVEDAQKAFKKAQKQIKKSTANDKELLLVAQKRAKVIIEENIKQFSQLNEDEYIINWEYEK